MRLESVESPKVSKAESLESWTKAGNGATVTRSRGKVLCWGDPQDKAEGHEGHNVTVKGTLDGDTIHVDSLTMAKKG